MENLHGKYHETASIELRRRAEEQLKGETAETGFPRTDDETRRLLHELQVHQIELEMQNAELCQARDELETALEKYTDLYDFAPVGYLTLDRDGAIRAVNLTVAGLLRIERSRLLGRRLEQLVAEADRPVFIEFLRRLAGSRFKESCEVALLKYGRHPFFVHIEALADASGQEFRAAVINISVRRRLEENLVAEQADRDARAVELADANSDLEAFNHTISHDLRRPLSIINIYSHMLRDQYRDILDDTSKKYLQEIFDGTQRMNRLIAAMLNFSRAQRVKLQREPVDLSELANVVAAELMLTKPECRIIFRAADGILAHGDAGLLRVVLDNLIDNAWKYTCTREGAVIEFGAAQVDGERVYFIRDNGPGFDMADAGKLFEPFQRIPGKVKNGDGIGLATVDRIISRHGGRVWVESKPGEGATFLFTLG